VPGLNSVALIDWLVGLSLFVEASMAKYIGGDCYLDTEIYAFDMFSLQFVREMIL